MLHAIKFAESICVGRSNPQIFACNDKQHYVVKFSNGPLGAKILVNEYICNELAKQMNLPVAPGEFIFVDDRIIEMTPELRDLGVKGGIHYGTFYYERANRFIGQHSLARVINKDAFPGIIAFDMWIGNDDRCDNPGNLIIVDLSHENNEETWAVMIDQGNAFTYAESWTCETLLADSEYVDILPVRDAEVYGVLSHFIKGPAPFDPFLEKIESFTREEFQKILEGIPDEWGITREEKHALCIYLSSRRDKLRDSIYAMKSEFPHWKGGE